MTNKMIPATLLDLQFLLDTVVCQTAEVPREVFCAAFSASVRALDLNETEVAKIFEISRPTVVRWIRGDAAPHPVGRKPILNRIDNKLKSRASQQ